MFTCVGKKANCSGLQPDLFMFFPSITITVKNKKENIHITEKERGSHQWIKDYNKYSERN